MSAENGRCDFEHLDYCCPPEYMVKAGFKCTSAIPIQEGDICEKCGATDADLMTEEEWETKQSLSEHDAEIRMNERGILIKQFENIVTECKQIDDNDQYYCWCEDIECMIESLRGKP